MTRPNQRDTFFNGQEGQDEWASIVQEIVDDAKRAYPELPVDEVLSVQLLAMLTAMQRNLGNAADFLFDEAEAIIEAWLGEPDPKEDDGNDEAS